MSGPGGTKTVRSFAALIFGALLASGMAACAYEDDGDPQAPTADQSRRAAPIAATKDPAFWEWKRATTRNCAGAWPRRRDPFSSPTPARLTGQGSGSAKAATVKTAGPYTVTATCVGIPGAQIFLTQDGAGGEPVSLDVRLLGGPFEGRCAAAGVRRGSTDPARPDRRLDRGGRRHQNHSPVRRTGAETVGLRGRQGENR